MDKLYVIKIGGQVLDDATRLSSFLTAFTAIAGKKVLVHGGGKLATRLAEQLKLPQQIVEGRRITDAETLKVVTMVYAGWINKSIVAQLQALGLNAFGLSGADGNSIQANKRQVQDIDYGFAGDVQSVNGGLLHALLRQVDALVLAPITHDKQGQLLNTNADTIAQETAKVLSNYFSVELIYSFEKPGVLLDVNDDATVLPTITPITYTALKAEGRIYAGMIPKLDNAFQALEAGVNKVIIGQAEAIADLITGQSGTTILNHEG